MLDCSDDAPGVVFPNPRSPLSAPAVACPPRVNSSNVSDATLLPNNATGPALCNISGMAKPCPVLRVFYGAACPLWPENAYNCSWDNIKQRRAAAHAESAHPSR